MAREMQALEVEVEVNQPAALLWQTHMKNFQVTLPAAVPGHFRKVEYLDGPPLAAGGVIKISYDEGFGHYDYVKLVWEAVDHENLYSCLREIDGGALGKHFDGLVYHYKLLPGSKESSSTMSWKIEYQDRTKHDFHGVLKDELIKFSQCLDAYIDTLKKTG